MLLTGIFPAIATPYYADGRLYLKKLEHNVDRYSKGPITGLVVLGSTGEAVLLNCEEQREVFRTAMAAAAPEKVMIAGCGHESVQETVEACEYAASLGYDVAMVRTPHYYRAQMTPAAMLNYYRTVADRSPLPVVLYSFPQCTGYDLPVELIADLAEHRNIIGIKESSGDLAKVERIVARTRHIKRSVRTTHDFQPVTPRMIQKATAVPAGEFVAAGALARPRPSKPNRANPHPIRTPALIGRRRGHRRTAHTLQGSRLPDAGWLGPQTARIAEGRSCRRHSCLCRVRPNRLLRDLRGV